MQKSSYFVSLITKEKAIQAMGEKLNSLLTTYKKLSILLLLSGGSALDVLNEISPDILGENITISMLDERFTDKEEINNFAQLQKLSFYELALNAGVNFFGTIPRKLENSNAFSLRVEKNLKRWVTNNPKGKIFATLGMGTDGHTAGIFPFQNGTEFKHLFQNKAWLTAYNAPTKYSHRVTTTITFFTKIDFGLALVYGKEKQLALNAFANGGKKLNLLPALAWKKIKNLKIYTDIALT